MFYTIPVFKDSSSDMVKQQQYRVSARPLLFVAFLLIAAICAAFFWPRHVPVPAVISPFQCPATTLAERINEADIIVTGSVFAVLPDPVGAMVIIEPLRVYRGRVTAPSIRIPAHDATADTTKNDTGNLFFASDQPPYLLFLKKGPNGEYLTSRCYGSRLLGDGLTTEEQRILGNGAPFAFSAVQ